MGDGLPFRADPFQFFTERFRRHGNLFQTRLFGDRVACFVGPQAVTFFYDERYFTRRDASPPHIGAPFQAPSRPVAAP